MKEKIIEVKERIAAACNRVGREASEVTLIAVSKTKPLEMIQEAYDAGMREFGENKPQELRDKSAQLKVPIRWHMIGTLQKNKIKYVVGTACFIHSVDSLELAEAINRESEKRNIVSDILLEVNIGREETKHGFLPEDLCKAVKQLQGFNNIRLRGLMTVAPYTENAEENRNYFRKMKELLIDIQIENIDNKFIDVLSMGMSSDYEVAIEEGATMVRIGTGIFGERIYPEKG